MTQSLAQTPFEVPWSMAKGAIVEAYDGSLEGPLIHKTVWPATPKGVGIAHQEWKALWKERFHDVVLEAWCRRDFKDNFYGVVVILPARNTEAADVANP